ncbi:MAG: MBL fold metallo-hydrolase [Gammaproteobacteria bacterium]|nr:MBL fold metallo-hydrolase [Gammaproteobacteria bacterium]MDH3810858.1 MBL fold metallo-hydrolase [Gammaproteobacteria bacterium]
MSGFGPKMEPFTELQSGIRRLVAPNPSMMTGPGTNTYLFGVEEIAVLDPGPIISRHLEAIQRIADAPIRWILVTHTHPDHSPAASVLAKETGAELIGIPAPVGAHQDESFQPDRVLADGDELVSDAFTIRAVHTPGHASNHVCFHHEASDWVFTGDHVIDGSTVVINPPDGNMKQYIESLRRLRSMGCAALAPGHGELIHDPERAIDWIIEHRLEREARVVAALKANPDITTRELVPHVYKDVDKKLYGLAERSLLAHLIKLEEDGLSILANDRWTLLGE